MAERAHASGPVREFGHRARRPEDTALHEVLSAYFREFQERADEHGGLPRFVVREGFMLANSRGDETEADEYGAHYASQAQAQDDPHGLVTFLQKLHAHEGNSPRVLAMLSDHPSTPNRIDHVNRYIDAHHLGGSNTNAEAFSTIKQRVTAHGSP